MPKDCVCVFNDLQKCSFCGVVSLWVKTGEIRLFGACISESPTAYTAFAPFDSNPVHILSLSESAEFQLDSLSLTSPALPSSINVPDLLHFRKKDQRSFQLVDETGIFEPQQTRATEQGDDYELGAEARKAIATELKETSNTAHEQTRILISGDQPSKTVAASIACINYILSNPDYGKTSMGVGFLDLDPVCPAFACPGTVSGATFRRFILGPSHTQPLQTNQSSDNKIISSFYADFEQQNSNNAIDMNLVEKLLRSVQNSKHSVLIVRVGRWFRTVSEQTLMNLRNTINPRIVLSVDRSRISEFHDAALGLSKLMSVDFVRQPSFRSIPPSALTAHKLLLMSHYLFYGYVGGRPLWYDLASINLDSRKEELPFMSADNGVNFIIVRGGSLRPQDIPEALCKAMVMIVARAGNGQHVQYASAPLDVNESDLSCELRHVGVAQVQTIDETKETIVLNTPVTLAQLTEVFRAGLQVGLVVQKPSNHGWFDPSLLHERP